MKKAKWAAIGIALLIAVSPPAKAETTTTFTPKTGTNYVIRNVETGLFLSCSSHSAKAAYFGSKIEDNYYLWQFTASDSEGGWKLYNEGRSGYLNNEKTSSTYRGKTDATGATWYITTNTLNPNGYLISSSNTTPPTNCLYAYKDGSYYLCSTEKEEVNLGTHGATNYYQLPTFQFYTYDDLYNLAKQCGYTGTEATTPTATDWTALTSYISTARKLSDNNVVSTATNGEAFVIASRRYHKFLSTDGKGNFHSADRITTSSTCFRHFFGGKKLIA